MKKTFFILPAIAMLLACTCTEHQLTISDDNIMGLTTNDIIAYLETNRQELTSDSMAEALVSLEQHINDIQGWADAMKRTDSCFNVTEHDTTQISVAALVPLLDSVLTQAIDYLQKGRGTDYLALMEDNWDTFTLYGPMAFSHKSFDLLMTAYAPYYWALHATVEKDTAAFFEAVLDKLDLIHYTARGASLLHNPPTPFYSYFTTTHLGMLCYMQMEKYEDALQWGDTYLTDLVNWDFVRYNEFVERNAFDLHIDILNRMQYCYLKIGADSSAVRMEMLKTLYPPTE